MVDPPSVGRTPIVYLDVDDVLIRWEGRYRETAPGAADFLRWLLCYVEVRWLTSWCPDGRMRDDRLEELTRVLGMQREDLEAIHNPRPFPGRPFGYPSKHLAVAFDEARPWVWIEDEHLHKRNLDELARRGVAECYIECNTSRRPDDLARVRGILAERFGLPDPEGG